MNIPLQTQLPAEFSAARFIKEIGRGKEGARSLSLADATELYAAMLDGRVYDLEMGGILLAMRIKGESIDEIAGFLAAAETAMQRLQAPLTSEYAPIAIPSYNGARKKANLTPLLACLLAREGAPVLVHGVTQDPGRVTTAEIFKALDLPWSSTTMHAQEQMSRAQPAFMPIEFLSPAMHRILMMRRVLGVRNSTHTLVKILQPFEQAALRLGSYTHPEYQLMLHDYFTKLAPHERGAVFLMRGTEGEAVASTGRAQQIDSYYLGQCQTLLATETQLAGDLPALPESIDADSTAKWIGAVLAGELPVPVNIAQQVEYCLKQAKQLKS